MKHSTRSKRVRQRPRTRKVRRHQDQPLLWPDVIGPVFHNRQVRVKVEQRGKITPYGGLSLAHDLAMCLGLDRDINRSIHLLKINLPYSIDDLCRLSIELVQRSGYRDDVYLRPLAYKSTERVASTLA